MLAPHRYRRRTSEACIRIDDAFPDNSRERDRRRRRSHHPVPVVLFTGRTKDAVRVGPTPEQIMEATWYASEVPSGAAAARSTRALRTLAEIDERENNVTD